jgi:hypothetical protein
MRKGFFYMFSDFKYLLKEDSLKYILADGMAEDFISHFTTLCMRDVVDQKTQHVPFSNDGYFVDSVDYQYLSIKIAFKIFREIDYSDLVFNRKIAAYFVKNINSLSKIINKNFNKGYMETPLMKIFSVWLSRYILTNWAIYELKESQDGFKTVSEFKIALKFVFDELFEGIDESDIEAMILNAVKITAHCIGFNDEIKAQKWVNFGLDITAIPKIYYENLAVYFYEPDLMLLQWLFIVTNKPNNLLLNFLEGYSIDGNINNTLINFIISGSDQWPIEFGGRTHKEISNIKSLLYLLNSMLTDYRTLLYHWRPYKDCLDHPYNNLIKDKIDVCFEKTAKYEAIHSLMKQSGSTIKAILSESAKQMKESEIYEKYLNKFARITKNREEISIFSLDIKHISHYNPFFHKTISEHSEGAKNYDSFYKPKINQSDKDKFIRGCSNTQDNPLKIKNSPLKFVMASIREAIIKTDLIKILTHILRYRKEYDFVDDDIEDFSAHILSVMLDYVHEAQTGNLSSYNPI